jgi:hypothetical protein
MIHLIQDNSLRIFCHWLQGHPIMDTLLFETDHDSLDVGQQSAYLLPLAAGSSHHGQLYPGLYYYILRSACMRGSTQIWLTHQSGMQQIQ